MTLGDIMSELELEGRVQIRDTDTTDVLYQTEDIRYEKKPDDEYMDKEIWYMYVIDDIGMVIEIKMY